MDKNVGDIDEKSGWKRETATEIEMKIKIIIIEDYSWKFPPKERS